MGDGAGCASVVSHMASLDSQSLFNNAILQGCPLAVPFRGEAEAKAQAEEFARNISCRLNDLPCYRKKTTNDILNAQSFGAEKYSKNMLMSLYPWGPTIDNIVVFYHPMDVFKDVSRFEKKPVIIGTANEEGLRFVYSRYERPLSSDYFHDFVQSATGDNSTWTLGNPMDARAALVDFITEYVFECPSRLVAQKIGEKNTEGSLSSSSSSQTGSRSTNVWLYNFVMPSAPMTHQFPLLGQRQQGICSRYSCNGHDARTLFYSSALPIHERINSRELASQMLRYWTNFVKSGSVDGSIVSRSHLHTLQLGPSPRTRGSRVGTQSGPIGRPFLAGPSNAFQKALSRFTYWPPYSTQDIEGRDSHSTMLLKARPLAVHQNVWQAQCAMWDRFLV